MKAIAAIPEMHELNIGHAIIGRAVMTGLKDAVAEMKRLMPEAWLMAIRFRHGYRRDRSHRSSDRPIR